MALLESGDGRPSGGRGRRRRPSTSRSRRASRPSGRLHPLTVVRRRIEDAFRTLGYEVADGPEIETDWYNFEALNFPPDHPARDAFDTFFVKDGGERATSGSSSGPTPRRSRSGRCSRGSPRSGSSSPGRVYRKDDIDPRHSPVFHQVEGLVGRRGDHLRAT